MQHFSCFFPVSFGRVGSKIAGNPNIAKFMCMLPSYYPSEVKYLTPMRGNLKFLI